MRELLWELVSSSFNSIYEKLAGKNLLLQLLCASINTLCSHSLQHCLSTSVLPSHRVAKWIYIYIYISHWESRGLIPASHLPNPCGSCSPSGSKITCNLITSILDLHMYFTVRVQIGLCRNFSYRSVFFNVCFTFSLSLIVFFIIYGALECFVFALSLYNHTLECALV